MLTLNLSEGFNPTQAAGEELLKYKLFLFSGGEPHIVIENHEELLYEDTYTISLRYRQPQDLITLAIAVDALKRVAISPTIRLIMPYFPGARQDRAANFGEAFTLNVFANFINSLHLDQIVILDPHSDVTPALLYSVTPYENSFFIEKVVNRLTSKDVTHMVLVAPDAGAMKKCNHLMEEFPNFFVDLIPCLKTRDTKTGKLSNFQIIFKKLHGMPCLVADDICDGGGTFVGVAEALRPLNPGNLVLATTHGIFSKGLSILGKFYSAIYTTDSIHSAYQGVEVIPYHEMFE